MIIIPSIDLREGRVVRLQQGDYSRQLNYDVDPIETAKQFAAAGARWCGAARMFTSCWRRGQRAS